MLEMIKCEISQPTSDTFYSKYIDYIIKVHNRSILLEMEYLTKHNKLDVLGIDALISKSFDEVLS